MKDQATPPGQCLMENKRINKENNTVTLESFP